MVFTSSSQPLEPSPYVAQLEAYAQKLFYEKLYGDDESVDYEKEHGVTMPQLSTSVINAITSYYSNIYDALFSTGYVNILIAEELAKQTSDYQAGISEVYDLLKDQVLADFID